MVQITVAAVLVDSNSPSTPTARNDLERENGKVSVVKLGAKGHGNIEIQPRQSTGGTQKTAPLEVNYAVSIGGWRV